MIRATLRSASNLWPALAAMQALAVILSAACARPAPELQPGLENLEILGLRNWTVSMLADSIERYRPGTSLTDAACAAVLRDNLGFPDAAVLRFRDGRVVLTVIEPGDTGRVALRVVSTTSPPIAGPWDSIAALARLSPFGVEFATNMFPLWVRGEGVPVARDDSVTAFAVWTLLGSAKSQRDFRSALDAVKRHPQSASRAAAAHYLIRYPEHDDTWLGLVNALRDTAWTVRGAANSVLGTLRRSHARAVDWTGATEDLRFLLAGTTLTFHTEVVRLLLATEIATDLASALVTPAAETLLREQANAHHEYLRLPAASFLERLRTGSQ